MCLGVPGRVDETYDVRGTRMARVDFGGVRKEVCLAYVPEAEVGDYVIVHVGFAITRLDEAAALETLALFREAGLLDAELGGTGLGGTELGGTGLGVVPPEPPVAMGAP